eukprot:2304587-Amphidinium_carterae.1
MASAQQPWRSPVAGPWPEASPRHHTRPMAQGQSPMCGIEGKKRTNLVRPWNGTTRKFQHLTNITPRL